MFDVPVLLMIYNRPEQTKKVFEQIQRLKPQRLFISADGPCEGQHVASNEARKVVNDVDWGCKVYKKFSDKNMGCRVAVSSAIDWFFEHVEKGIILEDDTLPHISFFNYCRELLDFYKEDTRVMHIAGTNRGCDSDMPYSYYFSSYVQIWGWATWRRAWKKYDVNMCEWPNLRNRLKNYIFDHDECNKRFKNFERVYNGEIDTWDYQWHLSVLQNHGLAVIPRVNMISNIGFGVNATHTKDINNPFAEIPRQQMDIPLRHPPTIVYKDSFEALHK